jgi:hypothetical protein
MGRRSESTNAHLSIPGATTSTFPSKPIRNQRYREEELKALMPTYLSQEQQRQRFRPRKSETQDKGKKKRTH